MKRGRHDSFRFPDPKPFKLDQGNNRQVLCTIKSVTVSLYAGQWYVSVQTEREVAVPLHASPLSVGIDLGVVRFATLWDRERETVLEPINSFARHQHRLAKAHRQMAHKTKFSRN